jgi:hypothetical protein
MEKPRKRGDSFLLERLNQAYGWVITPVALYDNFQGDVIVTTVKPPHNIGLAGGSVDHLKYRIYADTREILTPNHHAVFIRISQRPIEGGGDLTALVLFRKDPQTRYIQEMVRANPIGMNQKTYPRTCPPELVWFCCA